MGNRQENARIRAINMLILLFILFGSFHKVVRSFQNLKPIAVKELNFSSSLWRAYLPGGQREEG